MNKKILLSSLIFTILDIIWIKKFMGPRYKIMVEKIQNSIMKVDISSAAICYLVICFTINYFVLPYVPKNNYKLFNHSFIMGIVLYAVYDLTCAAVFKDWDKKLMVIDIFWGGFSFFLTTYLTNHLLSSNFN